MEEPRRLGNRYELGAVLGRGGMAEVFMARDIRLGRAVAVKTLRADMARDAIFQARFRREAQSAASLNHPAIVAVYDTGEDYISGLSLPYIVMEYVDGSTLRDLLHSGRRLLPERALEITSGVLQALDYSHRNGIIHRDIKPANVMLTRAGAVKVMDFGIARAMGDQGMTMTQTSAVIGTAQYLSPEQAKGETVDARSDLYSTACLLYELLTGRPPFVGDSPVAVAYQHVREAPLAPSRHDPEVPAVADAIVLKGLAKHPDDRYQSADEMRADIERALDGRPIAAAPVMSPGYGANAPTQMVSSAGYGSQTTTGYGPPTTYQPTQYQPASYEEEDVHITPSRHGGNGGGSSNGRGRKSGDKTAYLLLGGGFIVAVVLVLVLLHVMSGGGNGTSTTVPNIVGQSLQQAQTTLTTDGLKLGSSLCGGGQASSTYAANQVIQQSPAASANASTNQVVNYCLSTGPAKYQLPAKAALNGNTAATVQGSLKNANFTNLNESSQPSTTIPSGNVIDLQNNNGDSLAGQTVPVTTPITIVVSNGPQQTTLPDVTGHALQDAQNTLTHDGFTVGAITYQSSDTVPSGDVISQTPAGNSQAAQGTSVSLVVSQGPAGGGGVSPSPSCSFGGLVCTTPSDGNGNGNGGGQ